MRPQHFVMEYFPKNRQKLVKNDQNWLKNPENAPQDLLNPPGSLSTRWARLFGTIRYASEGGLYRRLRLYIKQIDFNSFRLWGFVTCYTVHSTDKDR